MTFTTKLPVDVIFPFWEIENASGLILSCLVLCFFGIGHEYLKMLQIRFAKQRFDIRCAKSQTANGSDDSSRKVSPEKQLDSDAMTDEKAISNEIIRNYDKRNTTTKCNFNFILKHFLEAIAHCTLLAWSYILMLSVMTMNPAIITSAVGGCAIGYFWFHRKAQKEKAANEIEEEVECLSNKMKETDV